MTTIEVGGADPELRERLSAELTAFNNAATGAYDEADLSARATDAAGTLAGGLVGWSWGGCGGVNLLWVAPEHRGRGVGSRLLAAAEAEAVRRGCTRMVVSSMTFQAPGFYRRHGYRETGRIEGLPAGSEDVHFYKPLDGTPPRLRLVAIVDAPAEHAAAVRGYEDRVLGLLGRHGGRVEARLHSADGRTEVQTISFADEAGYRAFLADPQRAAYREELGDVAPDARVVHIG
jgi:ribosomal protein S18 acetylase RimI-like enzyme